MTFMEEKSVNEPEQVKNQSKIFESRFEAIAQTASDSIIISDEHSRIVFANVKANEVFGYNQEDLIGKDLQLLMPKKHREGHLGGMKNFMQSKMPKLIGHTVEIEGLKKDGTIFPIELSLSSWKENGKYFFSGIIRDITERRQQYDEIYHLNIKLKEQQKELELANRELNKVNTELVTGKIELQAVLDKLGKFNNELEQRVEERTHELALSENQLKLITDALPVLISYVDADSNYRFINQAYEKWFNVSREDVYGKHVGEILGVTIYTSLKGTIDKVLKGETLYLETKFNYKEVGLKDVSINYIPHIIKEKVAGYFTLVSDISEHKKAQEGLLKANEEINLLLEREKAAFTEVANEQKRLYNMLMQAPAIVAIMRGEDFVYEMANSQYLKLFGINELIEGKTLKEVLPDLDKEVIDILEDVYHNGKRFIGNELPVYLDWQNDGEPFTKYFNLIYEPLRDLEGSLTGIMVFGNEVTEHVISRENLEKNAWTMKQMNKALKKKNQDLRKLNVDLDNFIYTASHDLKSPAVNLEGLITLLKKEFDHKFEYKDRSLIEMIEKSIHKLYKTILDLTEITKAQKDIDGEQEEVSIKELLEDVKINLNQNIQSAEASIKVKLNVDILLFNKSNLKSILFNLISNAIKYRAPERPLKIFISSYVEKETAVLCVEDNGLGVDEHQLPKLFTMFKRLHTHVEGTGIGLYIVKRIIENNGGSISVESKKNIGSAFKVHFPLTK